jgi:hypothetical protein
MGVWDDLEKRVKIVHAEDRDGIIHVEDGIVWKATAKDLNSFERRRRFKLPGDFRDFACTFGPGRIGRDGWCFYSPGIDWDGDPASLNLDYLNDFWINTQVREYNLKLLVFCEKSENETVLSKTTKQKIRSTTIQYFGWNPEDVTDPDKHEYGIYLTYEEGQLLASGRRKPRKPPVKVASTFREFVMSYALVGDLGRQDEGVEPGVPGLIPFSQTRR